MLKTVAALVVACALTAQPAFAGDDAAGGDVAASVRQRAFVALMVDGADDGQVVAVIENDDVLLSRDDARRANIPFSDAALRDISGIAYVDLARLRPGVTFRFEAETLQLVVTIASDLLPRQRLSVATGAPAGVVDASRPASAFGNYVVSATTGASASGFFETGFSRGDTLLYANATAQSDGPIERGVTYVAHDDVLRLRRLQVGDVAVVGDQLLADVDLLGFGIRRLFDADPYLYRSPTPSVAGAIASPGTADVYVNGALVRSVPLQPGTFELNGLPVTAGDNAVSVVVRDASGNVQTYRSSYFAATTLLRRGFTDYSFGAGLLRPSELTDAYGNPALAGFYRVGLTDDATVGARVAGTARAHEAEAEADLKVGTAVMHLGEAVSDASGALSTAESAALSLIGRTSSLGVAVTDRLTGFRDLTATVFSSVPGTGVAFATPRFELTATAAQRLDARSSLSLTALRQTYDGSPSQASWQIAFGRSLGARAQLSAYVSRTKSAGSAATTTFGFALVRSVGARGETVAGASAGAVRGASLAFRNEPPSGDAGFGYGIRYDATNGTQSGQLDVVEHAPFVDVDAYAQDAAGHASATVNLAGSIVSVAGKVLPSRAVGDAFALVETGDVGGVPVTIDGRPAGRTDASGFLVVPSLGAYLANDLSIDESTLPLDVELSTDRVRVAPGYRGGAVAAFGARHITYVTGRVTLSLGGRDVVPAGGTLFLDASGLRSPLDDDGAYYFENLAPGRYRATIHFGATTCTFALTVSRATGAAANLGTSTCAP